MSRTGRRMDTDSIGISDVELWVPATIANVTGTLTPASTSLVRTANGNSSLAIIASQTVVLEFPLSLILARYGVADDLQQQFGGSLGASSNAQPIGSPFTLGTATTAAGSNISVPVLSSVGFTVGSPCLIDTVASGVQETAVINAIPDVTHIQFATLKNAHTFTSANATFPIQMNIFSTPADAQGVPPLAGVIDITPQTTPRVKGILFRQIHPVYTVTTNPLSLNTLGMTKTVFANGVAPAVTVLLANAANGLATAAAAQPYETPITLTIANQVFQTSRFAEYMIEWDVTTPVGGTANIFGFFLDVTLNLG
jgi:hypothetical protein